ncbi:hypothetical protein HK405_010886 [Cladochytrium tenue]|nr:hypothetical protein HK405_010886 [Cladochytrium tenue]
MAKPSSRTDDFNTRFNDLLLSIENDRATTAAVQAALRRDINANRADLETVRAANIALQADNDRLRRELETAQAEIARWRNHPYEGERATNPAPSANAPTTAENVRGSHDVHGGVRRVHGGVQTSAPKSKSGKSWAEVVQRLAAKPFPSREDKRKLALYTLPKDAPAAEVVALFTKPNNTARGPPPKLEKIAFEGRYTTELTTHFYSGIRKLMAALGAPRAWEYSRVGSITEAYVDEADAPAFRAAVERADSLTLLQAFDPLAPPPRRPDLDAAATWNYAAARYKRMFARSPYRNLREAAYRGLPAAFIVRLEGKKADRTAPPQHSTSETVGREDASAPGADDDAAEDEVAETEDEAMGNNRAADDVVMDSIHA